MRTRNFLVVTLVALSLSGVGRATDSVGRCEPMPDFRNVANTLFPTLDPHGPTQVTVVLELTIQPNGFVSEVRILTKEPADIARWSDKPILKRVKQFRFRQVPKACVGIITLTLKTADASVNTTSLERTRGR